MSLPSNFRVIPGNSAHNSAPIQSWNTLIQALSTGPLAGASRTVHFNENGENLVNITDRQVVALCQKGDIWIDYCGWPMYGFVITDVGLSLIAPATGPQGFADFLDTAGAYLPYDGFDTTPLVQADILGETRWPYNRSLVLTSKPPLVPWFIPNLLSPNARPYEAYAPDGPTGEYWVYTLFAILIGQGAYLYAYGGMPGGWFSAANPGVSPIVYAEFVNRLASHIGQYGVEPVSGGSGSSGSSGSTPTGGTPTGGSSGSAPPSGSSGTPPASGTPGTGANLAQAAGGLSTGAQVAVALAVGAVAVGGYLLASGDE